MVTEVTGDKTWVKAIVTVVDAFAALGCYDLDTSDEDTVYVA